MARTPLYPRGGDFTTWALNITQRIERDYAELKNDTVNVVSNVASISAALTAAMRTLSMCLTADIAASEATSRANFLSNDASLSAILYAAITSVATQANTDLHSVSDVIKADISSVSFAIKQDISSVAADIIAGMYGGMITEADLRSLSADIQVGIDAISNTVSAMSGFVHGSLSSFEALRGSLASAEALVHGSLSTFEALRGSLASAEALVHGSLSTAEAYVRGSLATAESYVRGSVATAEAYVHGSLSSFEALRGSLASAEALVHGSLSTFEALRSSLASAEALVHGSHSTAELYVRGSLATAEAFVHGSLSSFEALHTSLSTAEVKVHGSLSTFEALRTSLASAEAFVHGSLSTAEAFVRGSLSSLEALHTSLSTAEAFVRGSLSSVEVFVRGSLSNTISFIDARVTSLATSLALGYYNVKAYGAVGDGSVDDTAAINNAISAAGVTGGTVFLPRGKYKITGTGLEINKSAMTADDQTRVSILGSGPGNTWLDYAGTGTCLTYDGSSVSAGFHSHLTIQSLRINGPGATADSGLVLSKAAYFAIRDIVINGFNYGLVLYDSISGVLDRCVINWNAYGITAQYNVFTAPNAITLLGCVIGNNSEYGATFGVPTTVNFVGGSVEGNGTTGNDASRYGVLIANQNATPIFGAASANFDGVYFEGNATIADIWFASGINAGPSTITVKGCTFNRVTSLTAGFVTNNIRVDQSSVYVSSVVLLGNGFRGFNSYSVNASRPYVALNPVGGANNWNIVDLGNMYESGTERPILTGPIIKQHAVSSAWIRFDGNKTGTSTATLVAGFNVSQVIRSAAGEYKIVFERSLAATALCVGGMVNGRGYINLFAENAGYVQIHTQSIDATGVTSADFSAICLQVYGNNDLV